MDCIVLAGSGESYQNVADCDNKAFLPLAGKVVIEHVIEKLKDVAAIERIFVIGPKADLEKQIKASESTPSNKPVLIFEQKTDLVENILSVFEETKEGQPEDRVVLILPSDTPLLTAYEVNQFIERCDMQRYDYQAGITTEEAMSQFYPEGDKPGIVMTYFYFNEGHYRINNLHMVRPSAFSKMDYIRKTYALRYQKNWFNILKMVWNVFKVFFIIPGGPILYLGMQTTRLAHESGRHGLGRWLEKKFKKSTAERYIAKLLNIRMSMVTTDLGSTAIDIDNEKDYQAICARFDEWQAMLKQKVLLQSKK